jgi:hypothetical protein
MQRFTITIFSFFIPLAIFAASDDYLLRFSTEGQDRYADGTVVPDGECYALVWSPAGKAFSGFNADGTAASASDRVVLAGALALEGRCRDSLFQISAAEYEPFKDGEWAVCLVDTRRADGIPAGVANGRPKRVNRWGIVKGGVSIEPAQASGLAPASSLKAAPSPASAKSGTGVRATQISSVPSDAQSPTITAMELSDGIVTLSVTDTVPYLSYTIESGARLNTFAIDGAADVVDGETGVEIEIGTGAHGATRFFRIIRAE